MKKMICFVMVVIFLISLVTTAFAGYVVSGNQTLYEDSVKLEWFNEDNWETVSGIRDITIRNMGSSNVIYVTSNRESESMTIAYSDKDGIDLSAYNELVVEMIVNNGKNCTYSITYYYEDGSFTDKVNGTTGSKNFVYFMLPIENKSNITKIEFSVKSIEDDIDNFAIASFHADSNWTYSYSEIFQSRRLSAVKGSAQFFESYVEMIPEENEAGIECELTENYKESSVLVVVEVNSLNAGMISAENSSTGEINTSALYSGVAKYSFYLSDVKNKIRIGFSGGDNSAGNILQLLSVNIIPVTEDESVKYGTVENCYYDDGKIVVKGTVDPDATIKYINSSLALYKVPYDYNGELTDEPEVEMSISTVYTLEAPVDYDYTQYKYVVALKSKYNIVSLTSPVFAIAKTSEPTITQDCYIGIHNAESASVFESEVDNVIVDMHADRLFASSDTVAAVRYAYRDNVYYLNSDYINEISSNISFNVSIGCKVYIRLFSDEDGSFGYDVKQKSSVDLMCAAASYIGSHFDKVSGVIVLSGFNYHSNPDNKAKEASSLLGLFSSAFRSVNSNAEIFVSISDDVGYAAAIMATYNKANGINNMGLLYECDAPENSIVSLQSVCDSANTYGSSFGNQMILCKIKKDELGTDDIKTLYVKAVQSAVSGIVFSVSGNMTTDEICALVDSVQGNENSKKEFVAFKNSVDYRGEYALWDFTQAYNTFGWLAGGSCLAPETQKSVFGEKRVLRSKIVASYGEEGILVGWLEGGADLSVADAMKIELALETELHSEMPVRIVLGGDGAKAEYSASAKKGEQNIYLDISNYKNSDRVEYVAVIIDSKADINLEISKVSMLSHSLAENELKDVLGQSNSSVEQNSVLYIFIGAIVSSTIIVFVALSKKKAIKYR